MKEKRVDVLLSLASFLQLMFLGFAGSLVAELIKSQQNNITIFWSSLAALILTISIMYVYSEVLFITKYK